MDALVTFYAETGVPHVSMRITQISNDSNSDDSDDDDGNNNKSHNTIGLGFGAKIRFIVGVGDPAHDTGKSAAPGYKKSVSFRMPWATAHAAEVATTEQFEHKAYILLAQDCVSFARVFAQKCNLKVPLRGTCFLPTSFIDYLKEHNSDYVDYQNERNQH